MRYRNPRTVAAYVFPAFAIILLLPAIGSAQELPQRQVNVQVTAALQRLEMTVNTSRLLTLDQAFPSAQVTNPDVLDLYPMSPTQLQIFARKSGVTQINLYDANNRIRTIDVFVSPNAEELDYLLKRMFPEATLQVLPLQNSVVIGGYVSRPNEVSSIVKIAEDYYPKVINNIQVGGVQQVLLHVRVMEVSRTKLRTMGFDFSTGNGSDFVVSSVSGLIAATANGGTATGLGGDSIRFGIVNGNNRFFGFLEALQQNNLIKILAEPTLVTISGRAASFRAGGEFPIAVPGALGTTSIEFKSFGTEVDFLPIVMGNGRIRLEVRPRISELDTARGTTINNITVPGLSVRQVDTGVEMRAGQTLALAGLIQTRIEASHGGIPLLSDIPYLGAPFRRVSETSNEVELLIMVTPEIVEPMEAHEVPPIGPGMNSVSPSDWQLYMRGHIEVPNGQMPPAGYTAPYGDYEQLPPGAIEQPAPTPADGARHLRQSTPGMHDMQGAPAETLVAHQPLNLGGEGVVPAPIAPPDRRAW